MEGFSLGVFDVPTQDLIESIAKDLKEKKGIEKPGFTAYVKTGAGKERAPLNPDWYYSRMSSILYRTFKDGPIGTGSLRTYYGNKKNRGVKPHRFTKASGKVIRTALQNLESLGYISKEKKGRVISGKGYSYLTKIAKELTDNPIKRVKKKKVFKINLDKGHDKQDAQHKGKKHAKKDKKEKKQKS